MNGLQVSRALQPHHSVDGQLGEVVFVVSQQFGRQRGPGDVQQVLLETSVVVAIETERTTDDVIVVPVTSMALLEISSSLTCGPQQPLSEHLWQPESPSSTRR